MSTPRLSETSHIVLGLIEALDEASPYDLKRLSERSTANFWPVPHTQLYAECTRLARAGLLDEQQEATGRRRKTYRLTTAGSATLAAWRDAPAERLMEYRDEAVLKLFFGAPPGPLAAGQIAAHEAKLAGYEAQLDAGVPEHGMRLALQCGIGHEREFLRFWRGVLDAE